MLTNPNTYLILIFIFAFLLAASSFLSAYFQNEDAEKKHVKLDRSLKFIQSKISTVNGQLDSVSNLIENDFSIRYNELIGSIDRFQADLDRNSHVLDRTFSAVTNPHHPFDIDLMFTMCKYPRNPDNLKVEKKTLTLSCHYEKKQVYRNTNHLNAQGA